MNYGQLMDFGGDLVEFGDFMDFGGDFVDFDSDFKSFGGLDGLWSTSRRIFVGLFGI